MILRKIAIILLNIYFSVSELFVRRITSYSKSNIKILRKFLLFDHFSRGAILSNLSVGLYNGLHPKNVFNYRAEFFISNLIEKDVVIDIACGTGLILNKVSDKIQYGIGLEIDDKNLALCNKLNSATNIEYLKVDILNIDYNSFKDKYHYNIAIFSHILEHIENVPELLRNVSADTILICVPSQENWLAQLKKSLGLNYFTDSTHFREYTREMLVEELSQANYVIDFIGFNSEGEIICKANKSQI